MNKSCWIVTEGLAGTENQCLGVAEALGVEPVVKRISLREPWKTLSPYLGLEQAWSFSPPLKGPWPDLLIAAGRKAIAAARYIKRASGGRTFTVFLQDPRISPHHFDLVAAPMHDPVTGPKVIKTTASPNRITPKKLKLAKANFPFFEHLPRPRIAVLIGGNSQAYILTPDQTHKICDHLQKLKGGLMVTTSRRTGAENTAIIHDNLKSRSSFIWDGSGENPYFAFLGWADYIVVTADSASMLSEAASTGTPVYMIELKGGSERLNALHKNLMESGAVRPFTGTLEDWTYEPLCDSRRVADAILRHISDE